MSSNASLYVQLGKNQTATVDTRYVLTAVAIVLSFVTLVVGVAGNSLVIWVAGFKLKVENLGLLSSESTKAHSQVPLTSITCTTKR